jgi:cation transport regulator ChaC
MWVFGYGSLMWDGWEKNHRCLGSCLATLDGYSRAFDKASTQNWGSKEHPAPTLRIVASQGVCQGIAFNFAEQEREGIVAHLLEREGRNFPLVELKVRLCSGEAISALAPIYQGKRLLVGKSLLELARLAMAARGSKGSGLDYVHGVGEHIVQVGIEDPAVIDLINEIDLLRKRAV